MAIHRIGIQGGGLAETPSGQRQAASVTELNDRAREVLRRLAALDRLEALISRPAAMSLISLGAVSEGIGLGLRSVRRAGLRESVRLLPLMIRNKLRGSI